MAQHGTTIRRGRPSAGVRDAIVEATYRLIAERGLANLTTKEIAETAGASEASIYYHFVDKPALVEAVIEEWVIEPLEAFANAFPALAEGKSPRQALLEYGRILTEFWERILPLVSAVQSDVDLRSDFAEQLTKLGYGPHRGVRVVADYLSSQQALGLVRADVDPREVAMSFAGACFLSAYQRHMFGAAARRKLPKLDGVLATLIHLIER